MAAGSAFVVVDTWRVKPGQSEALRRELAASARLFRGQPGVLSVDYAQLGGDPERYLVVFRYVSRAAREAFRDTDALKDTMRRLGELWILEDGPLLGEQTGL